MVGKAEDIVNAWQILKPCRAPQAAGIQWTAQEGTPLSTWWAPAGRQKYLVLQGTDDQAAPPEAAGSARSRLIAGACCRDRFLTRRLLPVRRRPAKRSSRRTRQSTRCSGKFRPSGPTGSRSSSRATFFATARARSSKMACGSISMPAISPWQARNTWSHAARRCFFRF